MHTFIFTIGYLFLPFTLAFPLGLPHFNSGFLNHLVSRQVGEGVNGNQTNSNGSTGGTGVGDGNGVGFAGTGNDIDTGDDFDIGDGNNTIGDNNSIEIGDRITTINMPLNMSEIMERGMSMATADGMEMNVDISVRMRIGNTSKNGTLSVRGTK
ncbi:hypothetical protein BU23DRAFT_568124 [Bimuria novae-zelandiae CBS 107.79]|uniref:Uncharacterized protein n=1 Tax=Bimuria novae-zelandiae CBS 107.79 TaxID=1447943 RepID=A0A6A5VAK8_9PLEO|nr:hypothetical protein BU23DRAFT_568124 [Bimuria novae-zelandiae CBS 107.79]